MAIVGVVVLFITLVALGGYFLYRSLPGNNDASAPHQSDTAAQTRPVSSGEVLYIDVVGESSEILVRVPGGEVLIDTTMRQGQHVRFDRPRMDVTIGDPSAVEVYVNGELRDIPDGDTEYSFTAEDAS